MDTEIRKKKRTWAELRGIVSDLRRQLSSICPMAPSAVTFRTLPDGRTRIYFLNFFLNGSETTLLFSDVPNTNQPNSLRLQWQSIIESNFPCLSSTSKSSREEQLLWERKRIATWGINSYEAHPKSGKIIFPTAGNLFQCVDNGTSSGQLFPEKLRVSSMGAKINPQICPNNPDLVVYVCNYDIWVLHTVSGCNVRLTYAHKGGRSLADDPLSAGIPSYVMQEEFCRYQGYWWQPESKDGVYRILYEEVDDSDVQIFSFPSSQSESGDTEEFRYPRAGCANSKSNLKMVEFRVDESMQVVDICLLELQISLSMMFPTMEYLVRVGWTPDSEYVWVQLLDRRQQHLKIVLLSLSNFIEDPLYFNNAKEVSETNPVIKVIYMQNNSLWINLHNLLYFLPSDRHNEVKFIWANEDTGFRHLYLVTAQIPVSNSSIMETSQSMDLMYASPKIVSQVQLTSGEWAVLADNIWVDEPKQLLYFMGLRETPLEKHLYVVSLKRPGEIRMLSRPGYSYSVDFNKECSMMTTVYSNTHKPSACQVFRIEHSDWTVDGITLTPLGYLLEPLSMVNDYFCPELHKYKISSGHILYAMVFRPHNFEPGKQYPTILNVYGGPEVQLVNNTFKSMRQLRMHMLAMCGYCVIAIDPRGSSNRGLQFEGYIKKRMGTVELKDQIEVLNYLVEALGYIDVNRLAIHGWSYGGYMSLMGLIQYPDIFKISIAGAPVTNWNLYDTGYTERYMDLPSNNPDGYIEGSVLNYINKFPDEENRLLIIHGLIDENVHFYHTSQLVNSLIKAGKPYQLQVYPNERHSLRHLDASKHYETTLLSFLQNHL